MDGWITIGTELDTKSFDAQIEYVKTQMLEVEEKIKQADMGFEVGDTMKLEAQYEKLSQKLTTLVSKKKQLETTNLTNVKKHVDMVGNSINNVVKKVARWGLAVFGIRSAYMAVRNAMNVISQYDEQLKADLEYMRYAIAMTLKPLIEWIVGAVKQLMYYVGMIAKAWFDVDLWANSSADGMNKANKEAKKLGKTLLGFDELNVLGSNKQAGSNGVASSFDLSNMQGEVPDWLQWIMDNGGTIAGIIGGITGALISLRLFGLEPLKAFGIGIALAGLIKLIIDLEDYISNFSDSLDPASDSFKKFGDIISAIGLVVLGLGIVFGGLPAIITGAVIAIVGVLVQHWDKIKKWWFELREKLPQGAKELGDIIFNIFDGLFKGVKQILDGIIKIFKGDFKQGIISVGKGILNIIITALNTFIGGINLAILPVRGILVGLGKLLGKDFTMDNVKIPKIPYLATGGIVDVPKRGVNIGGAIAGEKGAEGVLPLTNSETMARLGQEIGKWITINMNITNELDGRVLNNRLQQINNQNSFSRNGV